MVRQGRGLAPPPAEEEADPRIKEQGEAADDQHQPGLAQRIEQGVGQAAAAEIADDLEAHRVREEGERLIFADQRGERAAADEEQEVEMEERAVRPFAVQPAEQPVEREEDGDLAEQQPGREGADFERAVQRARLAEAAAEDRVFALREQQFGEQGDEDHAGQGEPGRGRPVDAQLPLSGQGGEFGRHGAALRDAR